MKEGAGECLDGSRAVANITLLSLIFPPDNVSTAQLMADLAEDLSAHGHAQLGI